MTSNRKLAALIFAVIITVAGGSLVYFAKSGPAQTTSSQSSSLPLTSQTVTSSASTFSTQTTRVTSYSQASSQVTPVSSVHSCGSNQTFFSVLPISPNDTVLLTPLGTMVPPDHVFPAPHLYIYVLDFRHPANKSAILRAPGDMVLTTMGLRHYNTLGKVANFLDYTLVFHVCDKLVLYFHHVTTLSYQPFAEAASTILQKCSFSALRNEGYCQDQVSIDIKAGTIIGTVGDINAGSYGLDIGARDLRLANGSSSFADPARDCPGNESNVFDRCYAVCPFDYYSQAIRSQLVFGAFDGTTRTSPPTCGTLFLDVNGTGQGYWYGAPSADINASPEANDLYLGPDNVNTTLSIFSIGTAIPGTQPGKYAFVPSSVGIVNRNFAQISSDGTTYCYETHALVGSGYEMAPSSTVFLVKVTSQKTLQVQKSGSTTCGNGPWSMDSQVAFSR